MAHNTRQDDAESRRSIDLPLHSNNGGQKTEIDSASETPRGLDTRRPRHERRLSREEGGLGRPSDSSLHHETAARKTPFDSPHHRHSPLSAGDTPRRVNRQSVGSERSIEQSPLHPQSQARVGGRGSGASSPYWERKGSSEGSHGLAPSTPARSRLRSVTRGDDTPDHSPAVPKFGDWDDNDPASTEGYSHIFDRVREEKQTGGGKVPMIPTETSYSNGQKRNGYDNLKGCGCFPWNRS